jgi:hypothetical protein
LTGFPLGFIQKFGQNIGFGLLWLGFVAYAFGWAPPDQPDTLTLIQNLATGKWQGINLWVVTLFNLMGIWPMVFTSLMLVDGSTRKLPAWPFALGSFAVGAFAVLPYLALRQPQPVQSAAQPPRGWGLKLITSRWLALLLLLGTLVLLGIGVQGGNWPDFWQQWQTRRFIHVMSLDFCLLSLLCPVLVKGDLGHRGLSSHAWVAIACIPLLGPLVYLCLRPQPKSL